VSQLKVQTGRRLGDRIEVLDGLKPDGWWWSAAPASSTTATWCATCRRRRHRRRQVRTAMNFSALSIKNPIPAIMLFVLLTLAGLLAYKANAVQDFPDIELPIVTVTATLDGAAPAQLETEVARKIEDSVATLQGVKNIYTKVLDGVATVTVEFILEKNDFRRRQRRARRRGAGQGRPAGRDARPDRDQGFHRRPHHPDLCRRRGRARAASLDDQEVSWFVDKRRGQAPAQRARAWARSSAWAACPRDPRRTRRRPHGRAEGGRGRRVAPAAQCAARSAGRTRRRVSGAEQSVRTIATVKTADELAAMDIPLPDGRRVRLDQVATVTDTVAEPRAGRAGWQAGGRLRSVPHQGRQRNRGRQGRPRRHRGAAKRRTPNITLKEVIDNAFSRSQENFDGSMELLYEGAILAVLVVFWFLRDWRATLVAAAALPLSVIPAFLGQYWFGYTLNTVTLLSLALVVGVLVDDAIVEIENISRHLRMGKTPMQAAMEAADEIGMAVIATTFALVAVFLPTAFMGGIPGLFFKQFGWTAVLAILASLVVARLLTPMMAAYILKPVAHTEEKDGWIMQRYMTAMKWCLRHRW
jgi:Cu/Ag efflux pump CusA